MSHKSIFTVGNELLARDVFLGKQKEERIQNQSKNTEKRVFKKCGDNLQFGSFCCKIEKERKKEMHK